MAVKVPPVDLERINNYVVFGKVLIQNWDGDSQAASARLSIFDGFVILDRSDFRLESIQYISLSLQGTIDMEKLKNNELIVDLRCSTYNGIAKNASLIVIGVPGNIINTQISPP
ncbi:hypothetical protein [Nitrosomonas sp. Nm34]|uniref:hypothetical protein n=1 Tax=Nitrosomonas sp. Nm34 TaxID=1881055 RepID=UPI0008F21981|nr:hypothetical protein [Nitrosomonas sp. Nm34]SFI90299.1 hypothetical protein SAMN05428978_105515 [Nitrosomonas sp. Nm34]